MNGKASRFCMILRGLVNDKRKLYILILVLTLATRLPFLGLGYGLDGDSYLQEMSANAIAGSHKYVTTRPPGYPVFDFLSALFVGFGPIGTNGAVMIFSMGAFVMFAELCYLTRVRDPALLALTFVLFPFAWVNSMNTIDYMVALFFVLSSFVLAWRDKPLCAGLFLGLAIGTRLTSAFLILPLLFYFYTRGKVKRTLSFAMMTLLTASITFIPVIYAYGFSFLFEPAGLSSSDSLLRSAYFLLIFFGVLPTLFLLGCASIDGPRIWKSLVRYFRDERVSAITLTTPVLLGIAAFLFYPNQPDYLLPVFPFALLFLSRILANRKLVFTVCILLILTSFVNVRVAEVDLIACENKVSIEVSWGYVVQDLTGRHYQVENLRSLYSFDFEDCVIMLAVTEAPVISEYYRQKWAPDLRPDGSLHVWNYADPVRNVVFAAYLNVTELGHYQAEGYQIYYTPFANYLNFATYGYKLSDIEGSVRLDIREVTYPYM